MCPVFTASSYVMPDAGPARCVDLSLISRSLICAGERTHGARLRDRLLGVRRAAHHHLRRRDCFQLSGPPRLLPQTWTANPLQQVGLGISNT